MSNKPVPIPLAMVICDTVIEDKLTGKKFGDILQTKYPWWVFHLIQQAVTQEAKRGIKG